MQYSDKKKYGVCHLCGKKALATRVYCEACAEKRTEKARLERRTKVRTCRGCGKDFIGLKRRLCAECADTTGKRFKAYQRSWRMALKREVFNAYGGAVCACCNESELIFLTIDHVENNGAEHRRHVNPKHSRHTAGARFYGWLKRNKYPVGYQVLCMNCQWGKKHNGGICPHKQK